jgi:hypothetical protein
MWTYLAYLAFSALFLDAPAGGFVISHLIQRLTARVLKYEDRPPFVTSERQRPGCPRWIEFGRQRVFVLQPPATLSWRLFCGGCDRQNWRGFAMLSAAVKGEVRTFADGPQRVPKRLGHGGHLRRHGARPPR